MWTNGDDVNDDGEPVRLYQPIPYRGRLSRGFDNPTISRIGGPYVSPTAEICCSSCQDPLYLLAQLHVPLKLVVQKDPSSKILHRIIQVFGCNRASCFLSIFDENNNHHTNFCFDGRGVVACRRFHCPMASTEASTNSTITNITTETPPPTMTSSASHAWDAPTDQVAESDWSDDWGVDNDDTNLDMQSIESMVADLEMKNDAANITPKKKTFTKVTPATTKSKQKLGCFPSLELHSLQEPAQRKAEMMTEDDDEDDDDDENVGISSSSDDKIQQMLAKYMAEEDDEEILAALRGTTPSSANAGNSRNRRERDERLAPEDRALFAFTDRVKRAPRQVIRYARGGTPMWSVPTPMPIQAGKGTRKQRNIKASTDFSIPKCSCGAERIFECQLLPSLLHVLEVDKYVRSNFDAATSSDKKDDDMTALDVKDAFERGGMNWGSIAIYTCSQDCETSQEEYVIVQDSLDGKPQKMNLASDQMAVLVQDQKENDDEKDDDCQWDDDYEDFQNEVAKSC